MQYFWLWMFLIRPKYNYCSFRIASHFIKIHSHPCDKILSAKVKEPFFTWRFSFFDQFLIRQVWKKIPFLPPVSRNLQAAIPANRRFFLTMALYFIFKTFQSTKFSFVSSLIVLYWLNKYKEWKIWKKKMMYKYVGHWQSDFGCVLKYCI